MNRPVFGVRLIHLAIVLVDVCICASWLSNRLSSLEALAWHIGAVLLLAFAAWAFRSRNGISIAGSLLTCLLLGPISGFVLIITDLGRVRSARDLSTQTQHEDRKSRTELLHDQILQDRRRRIMGTAPQLFSEVFAAGSLADQQQSIAAISQGYCAEMRPALDQALGSDIPAIRVQAAAVYAKLRGEFGERAKELLSPDTRRRLSPKLIAEAQKVASSGFLDADTVAELCGLTAQASDPAVNFVRTVSTANAQTRNALAGPRHVKRYSCGGVA